MQTRLSAEWRSVLTSCQARAAHLLDQAYAVASKYRSVPLPSSHLNSPATAARRTLHEVVMGLCGLLEMDAALRENPGITEKLLQVLFQALVGCGALAMDSFRFPKHVMRRLSAAIGSRRQQLHEKRAVAERGGGTVGSRILRQEATDWTSTGAPAEPSSVLSDDDDDEVVEEKEEEDSLLADLQGAAMQCLYAMFGVDLPQRNSAWGDRLGQLCPGGSVNTMAAAAGPKAAGSNLLSRGTWLEVWKCLGGVLKGGGCGGGKQQKNHGQDIVGKMVFSFPSPPPPIVESFPLAAFLDGSEVEFPEDWAATRPAILDHQPPTEGLDPVELDMCRHIYFQRAQDFPDLVVDMLEDSGWEEVLQREKTISNDLALSPQRFASWEKLADLYSQALEALLADLAHWTSAGIWDPHSLHAQRVALLGRRARRAWVAARHASTTEDDAGFMEDYFACELYKQAQSVPPAADQRRRCAPRDEAWRRDLCHASLAFQRAKVILPEEWSFPYYMAKVAAKLGEPPERYLRLMAQSCHLATVHSGGILEPLYRLHASRMKLLLQEPCSPSWLAAAASFCFLPSTRLALQSGSTEPQGATTSSAASLPAERDLLLRDCLDAMTWLLDRDKGFHKAAHLQALAREALGDKESALEIMTSMFTKRGRRAFVLNVKCIDSSDATSLPGSKAPRGKKKKKVQRPALEDAPEEQWGQAPPAVTAPGLEETPAKNMAAIRKYLLHYIRLLVEAGGVEHIDRLEHIQRALLTDPTLKASMHDIGTVALGHYVALLASRARDQLPVDMLALYTQQSSDPPKEEELSAVAPPEADHTREGEAAAGRHAEVGDTAGQPLAGGDVVPPEQPPLAAKEGGADEAREERREPAGTTAATTEPVSATETGVPSLKPVLELRLAELSPEAVELLERVHRLVMDLTVAEGGVREIIDGLLQQSLQEAGRQEDVVWTGLPSQGTEALLALAEVHLMYASHHQKPPEDARKAVEAHLTALKKRFKSLRSSPESVHRMVAATVVATLTALHRQAAALWKQAEAQGQAALPEGMAAHGATGAPGRGSNSEACKETAAADATKELQAQAMQLLKRCLAHHKSTPVPLAVWQPEERGRLASLAAPLSAQVWVELLERAYATFLLINGGRPDFSQPPANRPPLWVDELVEACEEILSGVRRTNRPLVPPAAEAAPKLAQADAPGSSRPAGDNAASSPDLAARRPEEGEEGTGAAAPKGDGEQVGQWHQQQQQAEGDPEGARQKSLPPSQAAGTEPVATAPLSPPPFPAMMGAAADNSQEARS
mmetsp:Transcript_16588/g.46306  ORF Transcript_16588/g.46306 Transcript_16588/m.46306 type:complete len:1287 (-) Transcript_16588:221-4081(-)